MFTEAMMKEEPTEKQLREEFQNSVEHAYYLHQVKKYIVKQLEKIDEDIKACVVNADKCMEMIRGSDEDVIDDALFYIKGKHNE